MNKIIQGDSLSVLKTLPAESINCCVTSPPYWSLRDYQVEGQLGLEPTFTEYVDKLCTIFDEVKRVLKKDGTCWVNLSDTYSNGQSEDALRVKPYDTSDKALEDYQDYDYLCENLCDGCRRAYQIGKFHKENLLVPKPSVLSSLSTHENKEAENYHYSNLDSCQQENRNEVANRGQKQNSIHANEQIPSSVKSKCVSSSSELKQNVSNQNHEAKCLLCSRSLTACVQESEHKSAYINDIEKHLATLNPNRLDNVSLDLAYPHYSKKSSNIQAKSLCGIPDRFKLEMINRGWILRNTIIWHKPNCMPSSVKDRFTVDFEYVFFFVKSKKYWFETQYEPHSTKEGPLRNKNKESSNKGYPDGDRFSQGLRTGYGKEGRNKRTVWKINTKPFKEAHFAVFPEELVETPIKAGCPKGGTVLDCFCGSGTSGVVAQRQEKDFIGIELNPEYIEIAKNRLDKGKSIWT